MNTNDVKANLLQVKPPSYDQAITSRHLNLRRRPRLLLKALAVILCVTLLFHVTFNGDSWETTLTQAEHEEFLRNCERCRWLHGERDQDLQLSPKTRKNPRWNSQSGQRDTVVLRNATLFDGESTLPERVDIVFVFGQIKSVAPSSPSNSYPREVQVKDLHGRFVTPGLVDMHSHHLLLPFPLLKATSDVNEKPLLGPITDFVRAIDGFKPYDPAIEMIASGGVTSSLVLPGSGNIIGGEAYLVKNQLHSGVDSEPVVDELLLEYGTPENSRQRYLKMACGENPKSYGHTRMGLAWLLRQHLDEARTVKESQDNWCSHALAIGSGTLGIKRGISRFLKDFGTWPESFKLDTAVALLRGDINVNVHCYEPEDLERMIVVLHEFDIHVSAFHHALDAWKVPEMLKKLERNVTIATFAENALFKHEAYGGNLRAPKVLDEHDVKLALKSDHTGEGNFAKYLMYQAAVSHSFGLSEDSALRAVTSIPANSIQQGHRIGYVRDGYDADLAVWDVHPLRVGATPIQVYVDGNSVLDPEKVSEVMTQLGPADGAEVSAPRPRRTISAEQRKEVCAKIQSKSSSVLFTGIDKSLITLTSSVSASVDDTVSNLTLLVENGIPTCLGTYMKCIADHDQGSIHVIAVDEGYITPGLIAVGNTLGIRDISSESSTSDGTSDGRSSVLNGGKKLHSAKYGAHLHGGAFSRARIGGITKIITPPLSQGFLQGISVGLRTSEKVTILDGGIWMDDVALHVTIGQTAKGGDTPTLSSGVERLRQILADGADSEKATEAVYRQAATGTLPVLDDIAQLVLVKRDFPASRLVIFGGHAAPLVAESLAEASIPVILTGNRGAPDSWEKRHTIVGPPLTRSPAQILAEAGVTFALAIRADSKIHGLAQEAGWAGKFAGLSDRDAVALVSTNIECILGLDTPAGPRNSGEIVGANAVYEGDFVVWSGDPLKGEGSVVAAFQSGGSFRDCWPDSGGPV